MRGAYEASEERPPARQVYFILLHSMKRMTGVADAWGLLMLSGLMQTPLGAMSLHGDDDGTLGITYPLFLT